MPWMIGIDAGAAVLALENYLAEGHVRRVMHRLPAVQHGLERLGFHVLRSVEVPPNATASQKPQSMKAPSAMPSGWSCTG